MLGWRRAPRPAEYTEAAAGFGPTDVPHDAAPLLALVGLPPPGRKEVSGRDSAIDERERTRLRQEHRRVLIQPNIAAVLQHEAGVDPIRLVMGRAIWLGVHPEHELAQTRWQRHVHRTGRFAPAQHWAPIQSPAPALHEELYRAAAAAGIGIVVDADEGLESPRPRRQCSAISLLAWVPSPC